MKIMGIETSCDETAVSIIDFINNRQAHVLFEAVSSQIKLHEQYGGVVPELASREHLNNLPLLVFEALKSIDFDLKDIDLIAVTLGPGLKGCLLVGLDFVKGLAVAENIPVVGVNHVEGHLLSVFLKHQQIEFPFLSLVVSGGHTELIQVEDFGKYAILCRTMDDAAGEAFDKSASLLGFPYPGGALLSKLADVVNESRFRLPKVMREASGFSFSGLKTAISLLVHDNQSTMLLDPGIKAELAFAVQDSIVDALIFKLKESIDGTGIRRVALSGGVAANSALRRSIERMKGILPYFSDLSHCGDNGTMIAYAGGVRFKMGSRLSLDSEVKPRWPIEIIE